MARVYREYYDSGQLYLEYFRINNKMFDKRILYCRNGNVLEEWNHTGNNIIRLYKRYIDDNGNISQIGNYVNNKKNGMWAYYNYADWRFEKLSFINYCNYLDGHWHGESKCIYASNGKIKKSGYYVRSNREGEFKEFDIDGNLTLHEVYENNKLMRKIL